MKDIPLEVLDKTVAVAMKVCPSCRDHTMFVRPAFNHASRLFLTLITGGLWAFAWYFAWSFHNAKPWHCSQCGRSKR